MPFKLSNINWKATEIATKLKCVPYFGSFFTTLLYKHAKVENRISTSKETRIEIWMKHWGMTLKCCVINNRNWIIIVQLGSFGAIKCSNQLCESHLHTTGLNFKLGSPDALLAWNCLMILWEKYVNQLAIKIIASSSLEVLHFWDKQQHFYWLVFFDPKKLQIRLNPLQRKGSSCLVLRKSGLWVTKQH